MIWKLKLVNSFLRSRFKYLINKILAIFGFVLIKQTSLESLQYIHQSQIASLEFVANIPKYRREMLLPLVSKSKSQNAQDLFVLQQLDFKTNGFFVEFGASNGVEISNTFLLERDFGWTGILAEPAVGWREVLKLNRPNAKIDFRCVWRDSNNFIEFNETSNRDLSTIGSFSDCDQYEEERKTGKRYLVETISLEDLLAFHSAPYHIDYLSIDTEGSELEILQAFDFEKHAFGVITCEHNFTRSRGRIFNLLSSKGYRRVFEDVSKFDDWYVK